MINPFMILAYFFGAEIIVFVPITVVAGIRLRDAASKFTSYLKTVRPEMDWQQSPTQPAGQIARLIRFFKYVYSDEDNDDAAVCEQKLQVKRATYRTLFSTAQIIASIIALLLTIFVMEPMWKGPK